MTWFARYLKSSPRPTVWVWAWLLIPLCLSPLHYAHAYIDPGSGSYIIQIVIGTLFGATYAVKSSIARTVNKIKTSLANRRKEK